MSTLRPHVIRRQFVEVDLLGAENAGLALHNRLPDLCNRLVAPVLDQVLTRCGPDDGWLVVDRLEVDLGCISPDEIEQCLPDAVGRAVELFFRDHVPLPQYENATTGNVRLRTSRQTADEALLVFLRTGRLPWSFRLPPGGHFEQVLMAQWTATDFALAPGVRVSLLATLAIPTARRRLIGQFSPAMLEKLLSMLSAPTADAVTTCRLWLARDPATDPAHNLVRVRLWETAYAGVSSPSPPGPGELLTAAWRTVPPDTDGWAELRVMLTPHLSEGVAHSAPETKSPAAGEISTDLSTDIVRPWTRRSEHRGLRPSGPHPGSDLVDDVDGVGDVDRRDGRGHADRAKDAHRMERVIDELDDAEYIDNSGIVLLHPFLPRFFDVLGVATGDTMSQPDRALALIHHLATGQLTAPEYELTLGKVLCNIPMPEPVAAVTLHDEEIAEATGLLEAAIGHWTALRNTGPDALRNTFLMRPGMLTREADEGWLLRVETQTVDILLDQLPWGISMIQTPWMPQLLRVEWR